MASPTSYLVHILAALLCLKFVAATALITWSPTILQPQRGDFWFAGQEVSIKWDTSNAPGIITSRGKVSLYQPQCDGGSPYRDLVTDFDQLSGSVTFTLPSDVPKGPHFFVLFGSSDNYSPVVNVV